MKFTDVAIRKIHELAVNQDLEDYDLRIAVQGGGLFWVLLTIWIFGHAHDNDHIQEFKGFKGPCRPNEFSVFRGHSYRLR